MENEEKKLKSILITGASSGIGLITAELLAKNGFLVFAGVRKKSDKIKVEKLHKNIRGVYLDVTNADSIDKAFWYVIKQTDHLEAVINNAGVAFCGPVEFFSISSVREQFNINTFGALALVQKFIPFLRHGRVINISSMASTGLFPFFAPYCASKRTLDILFTAFMNENKEDIKVVSIKPDTIKTPFWDKTIALNKKTFGALNDAAIEKYRQEELLLERLSIKYRNDGISPEQVAKTVLKALTAKNPRTSYFVGYRALLAELASKLPQKWLNAITQKVVKAKLN